MDTVTSGSTCRGFPTCKPHVVAGFWAAFSKDSSDHLADRTYRDIDQRGCSTPVTLECNKKFPCKNVSLDGVQMSSDMVCANVECSATDVGPGKSCCKGGA